MAGIIIVKKFWKNKCPSDYVVLCHSSHQAQGCMVNFNQTGNLRIFASNLFRHQLQTEWRVKTKPKTLLDPFPKRSNNSKGFTHFACKHPRIATVYRHAGSNFTHSLPLFLALHLISNEQRTYLRVVLMQIMLRYICTDGVALLTHRKREHYTHKIYPPAGFCDPCSRRSIHVI